MSHATAEKHQNLWTLTAAPSIWAAHFLLSYIAGALVCHNPNANLVTVRIIVVVAALAALAGIAITGWIGWKKHEYGDAEPPHDHDTPEDRHRFLGLATLMLSGLSAIATVFVTIAALLIDTCW